MFLMNNGLVVNVIPCRVLLSLGKKEEDITSTDLVVIVVTRDVTKTTCSHTSADHYRDQVLCCSLLCHQLRITSYKFLLKRDLIHANIYVPFSLHQFLLFWHSDKVEMVKEDVNPFKTKVDMVDTSFYHGDIRPITFEGKDKEVRSTILKFAKDK